PRVRGTPAPVRRSVSPSSSDLPLIPDPEATHGSGATVPTFRFARRTVQDRWPQQYAGPFSARCDVWLLQTAARPSQEVRRMEMGTEAMPFAERYGPWAVVAGASEGVGEGFARAVAERGVNVVLLARRQDVLDDVAASIREAAGVEVRPVA